MVPETADPAEGKAIFQQTCGGCHTLREAGTNGSNPVQNPSSGPNLDDAFAASREEGYAPDTIAEVVRGQIAYPVAPMPEDLLNDADADAVALYVSLVAGNPDASIGGGPSAGGDDPKSMFTGTSGTVGPNLDEAQPTFEKAVRQITNGGGGMPAFGPQLTDEQIRALARYVSERG